MFSRLDTVVTVTLRAGSRAVVLACVTGIAIAQNGPAATEPAPDTKPASAVPAPPTPGQTLPEAKGTRPAPASPAPTGSPAPTPPNTSASGTMRSLKTPASGFITAPAPVLPVPAASPSPVNGNAQAGAEPSSSPAAASVPAALSPSTPLSAPASTAASIPASTAASIPTSNPATPATAAPTPASIPASAPASPPAPASASTAPATSTTSTTPASAVPAPPLPGSATPATAAAAAAVPAPVAPLSLNSLKRLTREEILATTSDSLSIYVLRDNERTLVLDFPNIREQGRMFARLILFIERAGASKTRVMPVPEVQKWLAQNAASIDSLTVGNNMRTGELARFFNSARFQGEPMTVQEQRLYDSLLQLQLLREEESGVAVVEPERILVTVPQPSSIAGCAGCTVSPAVRAVILQHELSHARFATDTVYQNYSIWFWANALSLVQRDKFQRFLRTRGYDPSIRELCANEMQAFLLHTPDPRMFSAADVGMTDAELAEIRQRFQEGLAPKPRAAVDRGYQFE